MEQLRAEVMESIDNELKRANDMFPLFRSDHEGVGVIREELMEALEEIKAIVDIEKDLEAATFKDKTIREKHSIARQLVISATEGACELIQVAAMADKFRTSMDSNRAKERTTETIGNGKFVKVPEDKQDIVELLFKLESKKEDE